MKLELKRTGNPGEFKLFVDGKELPGQYATRIEAPVDQVHSVAIRFRSIPGNFDTVQILDHHDITIDIDEDDLVHGHTGLRTEGDEYVCSTCGKRWGFDDEDVPGCV